MNDLYLFIIIGLLILALIIILICNLIINISKDRKRKKRREAFKKSAVQEIRAWFVERYRLGKHLFFVYEHNDGRVVCSVKPEQYGLNDNREGTLLYKEFEGKNYFVGYKLSKMRYKVDPNVSAELKDLITEIVNNEKKK